MVDQHFYQEEVETVPNTGSSTSLVDGWTLELAAWKYLLTCGGLALAVRVIQCGFKAATAAHDEHGPEFKSLSLPKRFWVAFNGVQDKQVADYFLGLLIGFAEIASYPVLIFTGNLSVIGGWLAIKTAAGWNVWSQRRTAFNRFLFLNLLNLGIAYFVLLRWVEKAT
jgi:hypothetical protein